MNVYKRGYLDGYKDGHKDYYGVDFKEPEGQFDVAEALFSDIEVADMKDKELYTPHKSIEIGGRE